MAGAYCRFCDHRCFVARLLPDDAKWRPGEEVHLATCPAGMAYDRDQTGYDHTTAVNPAACPRTFGNGARCGRPLALGLDYCAKCETGDRLHREKTTCYVCGAVVPAREGASRPDCWHDLTVYEARLDAEEHDRRVLAAGGPVYSTGARTPEAAYVDQHRPY